MAEKLSTQPEYVAAKLTIQELHKNMNEAYLELFNSEIRKQEEHGYKYNKNSKIRDFKTRIIALYTLIRPKIEYRGKDNNFKKLTELDEVMKKFKQITLEETIDYYFLLNTLIEELGYTKSEKPEHQPKTVDQRFEDMFN